MSAHNLKLSLLKVKYQFVYLLSTLYNKAFIFCTLLNHSVDSYMKLKKQKYSYLLIDHRSLFNTEVAS